MVMHARHMPLSSRDPSPHRRRCLTLLEVLIALVLLAGLVAIVAPSVLDRLDERAFEAAADGTNEQLMMARAHAQATGQPVEVTWSPSTGNVQARRYSPWTFDGASDDAQQAIEPGTSPLISSPSERSFNAPADAAGAFHRSLAGDPNAARDAASSRPIYEGWATRALGRGIRIGTHKPTVQHGSNFIPEEEALLPDDAVAFADAGVDDFQTLEDLASGQDVRLAVFMPDGSALVGESLWLNDDGGRCGLISINPWSGLPMFQRLANLTDEALDGASDEDGDEGEDDLDARRDHQRPDSADMDEGAFARQRGSAGG